MSHYIVPVVPRSLSLSQREGVGDPQFILNKTPLEGFDCGFRYRPYIWIPSSCKCFPSNHPLGQSQRALYARTCAVEDRGISLAVAYELQALPFTLPSLSWGAPRLSAGGCAPSVCLSRYRSPRLRHRYPGSALMLVRHPIQNRRGRPASVDRDSIESLGSLLDSTRVE